MAHLVEPITTTTSLADCYRQVNAAHDYLAKHGVKAFEEAAAHTDLDDWGATVKRVRVTLPDEGRPALVPASVTDHSLTEVYNQCASIERLLDAPQWAQSKASGLHHYHVVQCHPTTSSAAGDPYDNELVLVGPAGDVARFEVSDVSSAGARLREQKDLMRLGVLQSGKGAEKWNVDWPEGRLFLVASEELAEHLRRPTRGWLKGPTPHCHYVEVTDEGSTRIFEVKQGAP